MTASVEIVVNAWLFGVPLVLLVWAALRLLQPVPARVRYLLVVAGLLAAIALPLWVSIAGRNPLALFPLASASGSSGTISARGPDARSTLPSMLATPVSIVWTVVALMLLAREVAGHLALRRTARVWSEAPLPLRRLLEWPPNVPLSVAPFSTPLTTGLTRPRVVLPADIATAFPSDVARRIALHELSHLRWRDPLVYALLRAAMSLFWFAPLWPMLRWVRREREVAADEMALRSCTGDEDSYVAALVRLSRTGPSLSSMVSPMAASDLEFRARRILSATPRSSIAIAIAVMVAATSLAVTIQPADLTPPPPQPAATLTPGSPIVVSLDLPAPAVPPEASRRSAARESARQRLQTQTLEAARRAATLEARVAPAEATRSLPLSGAAPVAVTPSLADHVHVDVDRHVAVHREDPPSSADPASIVREEVERAVIRNGGVRRDDDVIRIRSVIRTVDPRKPSRWSSFLQSLKGSPRAPAISP